MQKSIGVIKNGLLYLALFLCINYKAMEPEGDWKDPLMNILLGEHQTAALAQALDSSNALPEETRNTIKELAQKSLEAKTIDDAAKIIGALTHLDDALKDKIINPAHFSLLTAYLAKKFDLKEKKVSKKITQYISAPSHEIKQPKKKKQKQT